MLMSTGGGFTAVCGAHREDRFAPSSSLEFRLFLPGTQAHEDLTVLWNSLMYVGPHPSQQLQSGTVSWISLETQSHKGWFPLEFYVLLTLSSSSVITSFGVSLCRPWRRKSHLTGQLITSVIGCYFSVPHWEIALQFLLSGTRLGAHVVNENLLNACLPPPHASFTFPMYIICYYVLIKLRPFCFW